MHSPFEVRIGGDGTYSLDYDGASSWGWHSMNCTPSGMQGAIWVMFTQTLICNDKVNDGAYFAIETNFPEGTIANLGDAEGSTAIAWAFLQPSFTGFPRTISRALQARGFIEEVLASYSVSGNVQQGGGIDQYGASSAIMNFEISAQGMGAKYVLDGTDYCAAMFNPEGDMGDVEMWELISPFVYLSRRVKASSGGPGRHRGGSSFESLFMVNKTPFWELQNIGTGRVLSAGGLFGGYPGPTAYIHNIKGADLIERARRGEAYPVADGDYESPALMAIEGSSREYKNDGMTMLSPFANGDLYLSVMKGGAGLGDPLLRPVEARASATSTRAICCRASPSRCTGSPIARRSAGGVWSARCRCASGSRPSASASSRRTSRSRSRRPSPSPCASRRAGRRSTAASGTCPRTSTSTCSRRRSYSRAREPGKVDPDDAADEFLARPTPTACTRACPRRRAGASTRRRCEALLDEKLSRREVKEIQSGYKDADRFEKWLAVLQRRVRYERADRAAGRGRAEHRQAPLRRRDGLPLRLRAGLLRAQPQLEARRGRLRA